MKNIHLILVNKAKASLYHCSNTRLHKRMTHTLGEEYKEETTLEWFEQFKKK